MSDEKPPTPNAQLLKDPAGHPSDGTSAPCGVGRWALGVNYRRISPHADGSTVAAMKIFAMSAGRNG